jgi:disulfide bond formation protein DsbB
MNPQAIHYLNVFLGAGAIVIQIFCVVTLFMLFFGTRGKEKNFLLDFINKHFLILGFLVTLSSSGFAMIYSEIIKFAPCYLCWWQRVFMVPLIFTFGVAFWEKDRKVIKYILPIASIGFLVSIYHNLNYYFGEVSSAPCDASGISCYQHLVSEFGGYISIPMLALTSFLAVMTLLAVAHFYRKNLVD